MARNLNPFRRQRRLEDLYRTLIVEHDGSVTSSSGETFPGLTEAVPTGWELEAIGEALERPPVTVNESKLRRAERRRRSYVQRIVRYPLEYVTYHPDHVRVGDRTRDGHQIGCRIIGSYGETYVALTH